MNKTNYMSLIPVLLCFFAMGFVDLVGIASNYVKEDLQLSDSTASVLLVLDLFRAYGYADEQDRTQEDRLAVSVCDGVVAPSAVVW